MTLSHPRHRLARMPHGSIAGEILTAICAICIGLFFPVQVWVEWPQILMGMHYALIVVGSLTLALALAQRRAGALKPAILFAGYVGLPNLLYFYQTVQGDSISQSWQLMLGIAVGAIGSFGQLIVVISCLGRFTLRGVIEVSSAPTSAA